MDEELDEGGTTPAPTLADANVELSQPPTVEQVIERLEKKGLQPQRLHVKEGDTVELTKREVLQICQQNPNHPHVEIYQQGMLGLLPNEKVTLDRIDLDAIIQDKRVEIIPEQRQVGDKLFVVERKQFAAG